MSHASAGFERSLQSMNLLLKQVRDELGADSRDQAYATLRASLHAFRTYLPAANVLQLANQMSMLLRGLFLEGWRLGDSPDGRGLGAFYDQVGKEVPPNFPYTTETAVRAAFNALRTMDAGELAQAISCLPRPIRDLLSPQLDAGAQTSATKVNE